MEDRTRARARKLLDMCIARETGWAGLDDLADSVTVMNAIDEIESILREGRDRDAARSAIGWSRDILDEEMACLFD